MYPLGFLVSAIDIYALYVLLTKSPIVAEEAEPRLELLHAWDRKVHLWLEDYATHFTEVIQTLVNKGSAACIWVYFEKHFAVEVTYIKH